MIVATLTDAQDRKIATLDKKGKWTVHVDDQPSLEELLNKAYNPSRYGSPAYGFWGGHRVAAQTAARATKFFLDLTLPKVENVPEGVVF